VHNQHLPVSWLSSCIHIARAVRTRHCTKAVCEQCQAGPLLSLGLLHAPLRAARASALAEKRAVIASLDCERQFERESSFGEFGLHSETVGVSRGSLGPSNGRLRPLRLTSSTNVVEPFPGRPAARRWRSETCQDTCPAVRKPLVVASLPAVLAAPSLALPAAPFALGGPN
jgi:hypothetical protein